ncbi:MAG: hypothetical protein HQ500_04250 [Flavobacteriales bacterium]|nr:hypothetical protein [Flavobacteriales bacterium]
MIPHVHHVHDVVTHSSDHHHHEGVEHKHFDEKDSSRESEREGLLDFSLEHHTHPSFNSDYITEVIGTVKKKEAGKTVVQPLSIFSQKETNYTSNKKKAPPRFRNFKPEKPFLLSSSLKAPPILG